MAKEVPVFELLATTESLGILPIYLFVSRLMTFPPPPTLMI